MQVDETLCSFSMMWACSHSSAGTLLHFYLSFTSSNNNGHNMLLLSLTWAAVAQADLQYPMSYIILRVILLFSMFYNLLMPHSCSNLVMQATPLVQQGLLETVAAKPGNLSFQSCIASTKATPMLSSDPCSWKTSCSTISCFCVACAG